MKNFQIFVKVLVYSMMLWCFSCSFKPTIYKSNDNALTVRNVTQERDISLYEQGGHFYCNEWNKKSAGENDEKTVCDFILKHLNEKKRGYIKISCHGTDLNNTNHIFVEPDENGEWNIAKRTVMEHAMEEYSNVTDSQYRSVECRENYYENIKWTLFYVSKEGKKIRSM